MNSDNILDIKHKILFFFMPNSIVSLKPSKNDTIDIATIKAITPNFYWCSAHEFVDLNFAESKFLIQYQTYTIENQNIEPGEIRQIWAKSKNEIRCNLITFLDMWGDHQRVLVDPLRNVKTLQSGNKEEIIYGNQIQDFSEFATFVGKCIFDFKNLYINQFNNGNFLFLQKEFWKNTAMTYINEKINAEKTRKTRKIKPIKNKNSKIKKRTKKIT